MIAGPAPVPISAAGQPGTGASADGGEGFMALLASLAGPSAETGQEQPEESAGQDQQSEDQGQVLPAPVPASLQPGLHIPVPTPQAEPAPEAEAPADAEPTGKGPVLPEAPAAEPSTEQGPDQAAVVPVPTAVGIPVQAQALSVPAVQVLQTESARPGPVQPQAQPVQPAPATAPVPAAAAVPAQHGLSAAVPLERPAVFRIAETWAAPVHAQGQAGEPPAQAVPVPAQVPAAPVVSQGSAVQAPAAAQPPAPLQAQLAKPVFTLAAAGNGEHVMTMKVTPEELGTVTVRAVIGPEGVRMELFASDTGRDAVKAIMPDLRRELAAAGFNASLDLGTGARPDSQGAPGDGRRRPGAEPRAQNEPGTTHEDPYPAIRRMFTDGAASLDVLA